ncbi:TRAP transporter small permease [Pokkaliibacter sp. CJK22405]|uniref:TRAP transporter small permease n=1 Tax=Pokkaliibacter sp. CJK22405 TaxID=3384615 RepID=UPI003984870E
MKSILLSCNRRILQTEKALLGLCLTLMVALLAAGVFFRYVLNDPLVWSESIAKLLIVWMTFIGTSVCFAENNAIRVDSLVECFSPKAKRAVRTLIDLITLGTIAYMAWLGFIYFSTTLTSTSPILGISIGVFSLGMPLMFVFSCLHIITNLIAPLSAEFSAAQDLEVKAC